MLALFSAVSHCCWRAWDYTVSSTIRSFAVAVRLGFAVGPPAGRIVRNVLSEVVSMVVLGGVAGLELGVASERYIESLLYQVKATDISMLLVPVVAVTTVAGMASSPAVIRRRTDRVTSVKCLLPRGMRMDAAGITGSAPGRVVTRPIAGLHGYIRLVNALRRRPASATEITSRNDSKGAGWCRRLRHPTGVRVALQPVALQGVPSIGPVTGTDAVDRPAECKTPRLALRRALERTG